MTEAKPIIGVVVFSGDLEPDPDGAEGALREAGFEVARMPQKFRQHMAIAGDEYMEATRLGVDEDAMMDEIEAIVAPFGASCMECGFVAAGDVPFSYLRVA